MQQVTTAIDALPGAEQVQVDDASWEEAILAARKQYGSLSAHAQSLVTAGHAAKLQAVVAALTNYAIVQGNNSHWQPGDGDLVITANGAMHNLAMVLINGSVLPAGYYTVTSGSTIVAISGSYLNTLPPGQHTLTLVYKLGQVQATFAVSGTAPAPDNTQDSGQANTPQTGDSTSLFVPVLAAAMAAPLLAIKKHRKTK